MNKQIQIMWLRETANCVVEEYDDGILKCTKNRYGNRTIKECKDNDFIKIELSNLEESFHDIQKNIIVKMFGCF